MGGGRGGGALWDDKGKNGQVKVTITFKFSN